MSNPGPGAQPVVVYVDGDPVSALNPLPTSGGGGGGGTVDQGAANGDAAKGWSVRLTDGSAFVVPAKTGQLPSALGATTAASSLAVGIATDQLSLLATSALQTTGNSSLSSILGQLDSKTSTLATASAQTTGNNSLSSIDGKVATAANQATANSSLSSIDTKLSAFSSGTGTVSSVNCTSAANLFASNSSAKSRWIYNPVGNGTLYVRLGSGTHTGVATSSFPVEGGQFICIFPLDYKGVVQGLLAAGSQTIQATEVA